METIHQSNEAHERSTVLEKENQVIEEAKQLLYKRMTYRKYDQFTSPESVSDYLRLQLAEKRREIFYCLFLDQVFLSSRQYPGYWFGGRQSHRLWRIVAASGSEYLVHDKPIRCSA